MEKIQILAEIFAPMIMAGCAMVATFTYVRRRPPEKVYHICLKCRNEETSVKIPVSNDATFRA